MFKKILIIFFLLILIIIGFILYSSYKTYKLSKEKCGHLTDQYGVDYIYKDGVCTIKGLDKLEKEYTQKQIDEKGYDAFYNEASMKARDSNRVGMRLGQLPRILDFYYSEHGTYPEDLVALETDLIYDYDLSNQYANQFSYATYRDANNTITSVHLGVSLEQNLPRSGAVYLQEDDDFNSKAAGWMNGFSGDDSQPCSNSDVGKYCYDLVLSKD